MALYIRFMVCLAIGLVGVGIVLKTVIETLFHDWDLFAELGEVWRYYASDKRSLKHQRAEDYLLDQEHGRTPDVGNLRLIDVRRQQLREVAAVENRLQRPQGPIILTPMPPPRGAINLTPVAPPPAATPASGPVPAVPVD